jgi:hypothetical protein
VAQTFVPVSLTNDTGQRLNAAYFNRLEQGIDTIDGRVDGVERGIRTAIVLTASGGTITPNAATGSLFRHTATANVQLNEPINAVDGQLLTMMVLASGGERTLSFANGGLTPVAITAGQWWVGDLLYNATDGSWLLDDGSGSGGGGGGGSTTVTVDGSPVTTLDIASTAITAADVGADLAADHGFLAWSYDPGVSSGTTATAAGVLTLARVRVPKATTVSAIWLSVSTAGATLANSFVGLYDAAGTRLGVSADQSTALQTTGLKNIALTAPVAVTAGYHYVAILTNGTTQPSLLRGATSGFGVVNAGLSAPNLRFATSGTGLTALPSTITMSATTGAQAATWVALKV